MKPLIFILMFFIACQSYGDVNIRAFIPNNQDEKDAIIHENPIKLDSAQISYKKVRFDIYKIKANGKDGYLTGTAGSWGIEFHVSGVGNTLRMNLLPRSEQAVAELGSLNKEKVYKCNSLNYDSNVGFSADGRTPEITLFLDSIICSE